MLPILLNPFVWFALAVGAWAVWALGRWAASGGRLPLRGRRGSANALDAAGLSAQVFYEPAARPMIEIKLEELVRREEDEDGDPSIPGDLPRSRPGPYPSDIA